MKRTIQRLSSLFAVLVLASGCATLQPAKPPEPPKLPMPPKPVEGQPAKKMTFWNAEGIEGVPSIVVTLAEQRAYFFKGNTIVGETTVSSGKKGFETPAGNYAVIQKDKDHASNLYGSFVNGSGAVVQSNVDTSKQKPPAGASFKGAKMPHFLRFHGGYGMHAGRVPGYRASHGCVRLPATMARHFYENAEIGTPVTLLPSLAADPKPRSVPAPAAATAKPAPKTQGWSFQELFRPSKKLPAKEPGASA